MVVSVVLPVVEPVVAVIVCVVPTTVLDVKVIRATPLAVVVLVPLENVPPLVLVQVTTWPAPPSPRCCSRQRSSCTEGRYATSGDRPRRRCLSRRKVEPPSDDVVRRRARDRRERAAGAGARAVVRRGEGIRDP